MPTTTQARLDRLATLPLEPAGVTRGFVTGTTSSMRALWAYRQLLGLLVRREIKARYKDSALGFAWSLLRPLATLVVYYTAIGKFLGAERSIPDFAIFIFSGLIIWQLFSESVAGGTGSIVGNAGLIKKVFLPREVFPLSVVGSALFNVFTQAVILVLAVVLLRDVPTGSRLLYIPLALLLVMVWGSALGIVLSAVNVYLRDVQYLVEISLLVLFWASPVVYSWDLVSRIIGGSVLEHLYLANPVTLAVLGMQRGVWVAGTAEPVPDGLGSMMLVALAVGMAVLWMAQRVFSRLEGNFAQEL